MFAASVTERQLMSITALALSGICCILVMLSEFSLYKNQTKELVIIFLSFISGSIYAISLRTFDPAFCAHFWTDLLFPKYCIIFHIFW